MERKDYIIIILVIALVGIVSFSSAYLLASQPKNNSTNNSLNSSNNSNINTTVNQTSQVQSKSETRYISKQQAINVYKKNEGDYDARIVILQLVTFNVRPYYTITCQIKKQVTISPLQL